jgi:hypothetical protein
MAEGTDAPYIRGMRNTLPRTSAALALLAVAFCAIPVAATAQTVKAPPIVGASPQGAAPLVDLQIQESIDRRQAYQQLQQLQRQQDRDAVRYSPKRLEVPVMKPSCSSSVPGSSLSSGCR